jgi:TPR repeat protein
LSAASETTNSMTAPQDNPTAATQTFSEATPEEITAGISRRLVGPKQSQLGPLQLPSAIPSADEAKLIARAESLFKQSDVVGARLLLEYALTKGSARAAFMMAETYDWKILRSLQTSGVRGDAEIARELYRLAAAAGIEKARERLEALQSDVTAETRGEGERRSR